MPAAGAAAIGLRFSLGAISNIKKQAHAAMASRYKSADNERTPILDLLTT